MNRVAYSDVHVNEMNSQKGKDSEGERRLLSAVCEADKPVFLSQIEKEKESSNWTEFFNMQGNRAEVLPEGVLVMLNLMRI